MPRADRDATAQPEAVAAMSDKRLLINKGHPLHVKTEEAWSALVQADGVSLEAESAYVAKVMVRGDQLTRMKQDGGLEPIPADSLRERVSEVAQFFVETMQGSKPVDPPMDVIKTLLARDDSRYPGAPRVERVVDVPVLGPDGHLITEPGHHPGSGIFYRPAPGLEGVGPLAADTTEEVQWAVELLLEDYLVDFGFVGQASRAQALGLLLLPFVREFITGPTPMHGIFAPDDGAGSGKTYLAQACFLPSSGVVPAIPGAGTDDAEWRKRITSMLLAGPSAVLFDNLSGALDSGSLAGALTTGVWQDRVLGESRIATLPVRNVWAATGNGPKVSEEHVRRIVPIFLDPYAGGKTQKPSDRPDSEYLHPNLLEWGQENRRELVTACLTLVQHWLNGRVREVEGGYVYQRNEERRKGQATLGSFDSWAQVVGGVLEEAGVEGFLENRDALRGDAIANWRKAHGFLAALRSITDGEPWQTRDIARHCAPGGELFDFLVPALAESLPDGQPAGWGDEDSKRFNRQLSAWMTEQKWRPYGNLTLGNKELAVKGRPLGWFVQDEGATPSVSSS